MSSNCIQCAQYKSYYSDNSKLNSADKFSCEVHHCAIDVVVYSFV